MTKERLYSVMKILPLVVIGIFVMLMLYLHSDAYSGAHFSDEKEKKHVYMDGDKIVADEDTSLQVDDDNSIHIYEEGIYCFEGQLDDGQIIVDAGNEEKVSLRFEGVDIHCEDSAPVWIKNAGKAVIRLKAGTENKLSDGSTYSEVLSGEKQPDACIYSRADLTIKTSTEDDTASEESPGVLTIEGSHKNGISCSEDIRIKSGDIRITAANTAIKVKENLTVSGGTLTLQAAKNGIYCEEEALLQGQSLKIDAYRYGIFAKDGVAIADSCETQIENAISQIASHKP